MQKRLHQFYLTEADSEDRAGYLVKRLNWKGEIEYIEWTPLESFDWFLNKDYARVSREEWDNIGVEKK